MRRIALLVIAALLLSSCATPPPPDEAVEPVAEAPSPEPAETDLDVAAEPEEPPAATVPDLEEEAPAVAALPAVPEPAPVLLTLVNPVDVARISRSSITLAAVVSEGTLAALEIELVSGVVAVSARGSVLDASTEFPVQLVDASRLDTAERVLVVPLIAGEATGRLPPGLVDGERYTVIVTGLLADERRTEPRVMTTALDLDLPVPGLVAGDPTIDARPEVALLPVEDARVHHITLSRENRLLGAVTVVSGPVRPAADLEPGGYEVAARAVTSEGLLTRPGPPAALTVLADAQPRMVWPVGGGASLSARVGLHWASVNGATSYEARYREVGATAWQELPATADLYVQIGDLQTPGRRYEWQVRARNGQGRWFSWSATERYTVGELGIAFATVVRDGTSATLNRGYDGGSRDERPVRPITLTRAYEMAVHPLTNAEIVRLIDFGVTLGFFEVRPDGVVTADERRHPVLGLGALDYGEQFGLRFAEGRLQPVAGRQNHPAVGVSWFGAIELANLLSFAEGRPPAYDADGSLRDGFDRSYRLPTEAEWEYAARGSTNRLYPWQGDLSGRVANYYRSFDPFEDVNEPFTRSGGPTNPVGFFDGTVRGGFQTRNDASQFGIRDLVGNVWEWCYDRYDPGYYEVSPAEDPVGPRTVAAAGVAQPAVLATALDPNVRVVRGSAWNSRAPDVRLTNRGRFSETGRSYSIGVRLIRAPLP